MITRCNWVVGTLSALACLIAALIPLICSPEACIAICLCVNQTNCSKAYGDLSFCFEGKLQMVAPRKSQIWCKRNKDLEAGLLIPI